MINVSSLGHHWSAFNFDDPNFEHCEYDTLQAYGQSKTAANLFSLELNNRAKLAGVREEDSAKKLWDLSEKLTGVTFKVE